MIPVYNCAHTLRQTLESVLAQDIGQSEMEIEVIDDFSTRDNPEAIVFQVGKDRVKYFRQDANVGVARTFNTCLKRSRGHLVHILHGDDTVLPGFYKEIREAEKAQPGLSFFYLRSIITDADLKPISESLCIPSLKLASTDPTFAYYENPFRTPGVVIRRHLYEQIGGFDEELAHVADWDLWVRAIAAGGGWAGSQPLCLYRESSVAHTSHQMRSGANIRDALRLAEKWALKALPNFSLTRFRREIAKSAFAQVLHYRKSQDKEAAALNLAVWMQIVPRAYRIKFALRWVSQKLWASVPRPTSN